MRSVSNNAFKRSLKPQFTQNISVTNLHSSEFPKHRVSPFCHLNTFRSVTV